MDGGIIFWAVTPLWEKMFWIRASSLGSRNSWCLSPPQLWLGKGWGTPWRGAWPRETENNTVSNPWIQTASIWGAHWKRYTWAKSRKNVMIYQTGFSRFWAQPCSWESGCWLVCTSLLCRMRVFLKLINGGSEEIWVITSSLPIIPQFLSLYVYLSLPLYCMFSPKTNSCFISFGTNKVCVSRCWIVFLYLCSWKRYFLRFSLTVLFLGADCPHSLDLSKRDIFFKPLWVKAAGVYHNVSIC